MFLFMNRFTIAHFQPVVHNHAVHSPLAHFHLIIYEAKWKEALKEMNAINEQHTKHCSAHWLNCQVGELWSEHFQRPNIVL